MGRSTRTPTHPIPDRGTLHSHRDKRDSRAEGNIVSQASNLDLNPLSRSASANQVMKSSSSTPVADKKPKHPAKVTAVTAPFDPENTIFNIVCTVEQNPSYALQGVESFPIIAADAFDVMNIVEILEGDLNDQLQKYNLSHKDVVRIWFVYTENGERRKVQHSEKAIKEWCRKARESKSFFEGRCEYGECGGTLHYPHIEVNMHGDGPAKLLEVYLGIRKIVEDDTMTVAKKGEITDRTEIISKVKEQRTIKIEEETECEEELEDDGPSSLSSSEKDDEKDEDYEG